MSVTLCMHKASLMGKIPAFVQHGAECSYLLTYVIQGQKVSCQSSRPGYLEIFFSASLTCLRRKASFKTFEQVFSYLFNSDSFATQKAQLLHHSCFCILLFALAGGGVAGFVRPQPLDSAMGWEVLCECLHPHLQELKTQCKD